MKKLLLFLFVKGCSNTKALYTHSDNMSRLITKQLILDRFGEPTAISTEDNIDEYYYDFGLDWSPDSLETGEGICIVKDADYDGEIFDEVPCNCIGDWREFIDADEYVPNLNYDGPVEENPIWILYPSLDPNGDNWNDCGLDGICPGNPNDTNGNENGTEKNTKWDRGEGYEKNYQYDYDDLFGGVVKPSEYYFD